MNFISKDCTYQSRSCSSNIVFSNVKSFHLKERPLIISCSLTCQVLLATGGGVLVHLEICDGLLVEKKHIQLEHEISCLDINPIGDNPNCSQLAAVGMWTDISVRIFSLPDLNLLTKEQLGGEIIPRSVLLCTFEGVCVFALPLFLP